jgi:LysM repeat protein
LSYPDGVGFPLGGAFAMSTSFSVFFNGLRNFASAIEGSNNYAEYNTWEGALTNNKYVDIVADMATGKFKVPLGPVTSAISKVDDMNNSLQLVQQVYTDFVKPNNISNNKTNGTENYNIKKGDTLSGIAKQFGTTVDALADQNSIQDVDKIQVGQSISIPQ